MGQARTAATVRVMVPAPCTYELQARGSAIESIHGGVRTFRLRGG